MNLQDKNTGISWTDLRTEKMSEAIEKIKEYLKHNDECESRYPDGDPNIATKAGKCTCGLSDALAEIEGKDVEKTCADFSCNNCDPLSVVPESCPKKLAVKTGKWQFKITGNIVPVCQPAEREEGNFVLVKMKKEAFDSLSNSGFCGFCKYVITDSNGRASCNPPDGQCKFEPCGELFIANQPAEREEGTERMKVDTVYVCKCGNVFFEDDDFDTLGSKCGCCCPDCGCEADKLETVKSLLNIITAQAERIKKLENLVREVAPADFDVGKP